MSIKSLFFKKKKLEKPWEKYYTEEELNFKIPNVTMYDTVVESTKKFPNNIAYRYFSKKVKYKKMLKQINKCSKAFNYFGIKKGDIVTICSPNIPQALISVYALNKLGAIAHMIHPLSAEEEIKDSVNDTKSKLLLIIDIDYEKLKNVIDSTNLEYVVMLCAADSMNLFMHLGYNLTKKRKYKRYPHRKPYMSWNKFMRKSFKSKNIKLPYLDKNTPAVILHSGGTSGKPKYVVINNRSFYVSAIQTGSIALKKIKPGDSTLAIMPNFHGFGLSVCMHTPLTLGCTTILIPQFDSKKFDVLMNKTKPSIVLGVPTLFEALINCKNIKNLNLSYLKYIVSGGDSLSKSLEEKFNKYLKEHNANINVVQGYGLSEGLAAVALCFDDKYKPGSIGIPLARNSIKIIDPATREVVPYGQIGEICVNGPSVMIGYLNNESETNDALQMHDDAKVWLHTGDMGHMDEDGFLFYDQRMKRMIVTSGYNVYPSHIEEVIEKHPDVLQCTVVGMKHPYKMEVPKAFIVLKDGKNANIFKKIAIKEYCKKNLVHYMCPYKYVFRKALPKTKLGKIDFRSLQDDNGDDDV